MMFRSARFGARSPRRRGPAHSPIGYVPCDWIQRTSGSQSYVVPQGVIAGSSMTSRVIGQRQDAGGGARRTASSWRRRPARVRVEPPPKSSRRRGGQCGGGGGGGVAASSCGVAELLWRAANQSLFGEVLGSLQEAWLEPRLSTCVVATASSLRLDFRDETQPRLDASCELAVQTLGASDEPLVLATTQVSVSLSPARRELRQAVDKPRLATYRAHGERPRRDCPRLVEISRAQVLHLRRADPRDGRGDGAVGGRFGRRRRRRRLRECRRLGL
mmetsp:Transcript_11163/g.36678  ORF Transcript_11163/g.36678 Transcript_11163/m.36678 type:complete len:273 (+) Transcript_11163:459-1277(+)